MVFAERVKERVRRSYPGSITAGTQAEPNIMRPVMNPTFIDEQCKPHRSFSLLQPHRSRRLRVCSSRHGNNVHGVSEKNTHSYCWL